MGKARRFLAGILATVIAFSSDGVVIAANSGMLKMSQEKVITTSSEKKLRKVVDDLSEYLEPEKAQKLDKELKKQDLSEAFLQSMKQNSKMSLKSITSADGVYRYMLNSDGEATLLEYMGNASTVNVPNELDGHTLTKIGSGAFCTAKCAANLTTISLPDGLTQIGSVAFSGCANLTTISLPDSLIQIGSAAFSDTGIKSITIPKNIRSSIYDSQVESAMIGARNLEKIIFEDGITKIPASICEYSSVTEIVIPDSVSEIDGSAFEKCASLTTILLPDSLTKIGSGAFEGCASLTTIVLPDSLTQIGSAAFRGTGIKSITIPKNVRYSGSDYMESGAMMGASYLERIVFEDGMTKIPNSICEESTVTEIVIPDSVSEIGEQAFCECANLQVVDIPKGVSKIGENAFAKCTKLAKVAMNDNNGKINTEADGMQPFQVTIGARTFWGCSNLTDVELSGNVISIGDGAFSECAKLESLTLPESLTYIGAGVIGGTKISSIIIPKNVSSSTYGGAMADATHLKKVIFEDGMTKIPDYICANYLLNSNSVSAISEIVIPASVSEIGMRAFHKCVSLSEVDIQKEISKIGSGAFEGCTELVKVTMHDNDTWINTETDGMQPFQVTIGGAAFSGCNKLTDVELSKNVTSIGNEAFSGCSKLTSMVLGENVTSIDQRAFSGCTELTEVVLLSKNATTIGWGAFRDCSKLVNVVLSENITSIDYEAFKGCSKLESLTLPKNLAYLGGSVISGTQISCITIPKNVSRCGTFAMEGAESLKKIIFEDGMRRIPEYIIRPGDSSSSVILEVLIPKSVTYLYAFNKCENLIIYGYEDSSAKTYADARNIPFKNASEFDFGNGNGNSKEFYISTNGNALVGKELMLTASLTIFDETEDNNYDSFVNSITLQSSNSDIIDVSDTVCKGVVERLGSKVSIWLNFTVVPKKVGTVTLTVTTENGNTATKEIIVEPELMADKAPYHYITQKTKITLCTVTLEEADKDYLDKFMSSLNVKKTTEFWGIEYLTEYEVLDDGLYAKLIMSVDPSNSYDEFYTFEISSPGGQKKELTINSAVGNHLWSDENNKITTEDMIMSKAEKEYLAAFDEFIDKTQDVIEKNAGKVSQSVDNLADFIKKEYGVDITDGIPNEMKEKGWDNYLYEALSSKIADVANAKMSDISYSTDATTLGANIVKSVFKDYKFISDELEYKDKKGQTVIVKMSIWAMYGAFSGGMVCENAQNPSERYTVGVCMTREHTDKVLKQYANDLAKLGASAANSIYYAMAEDLLGKSLKDFVGDFIKNYAKKYGAKLAEIGLGGLVDFCSAGYDVYKDVNTFSKTLSNKEVAEIYGQLKDSKEALDSFSDNATDKNVKRASGKVVKAAQKILLLWEEYMTTGTVKSNNGIIGWIQSKISCPVSISIYDKNGAEIGYVGDDDIWYNDNISIREQGDAKVIYTPFDEQVSFKMNGTGYGTLSCAFEEYDKDGNTLGRLNYYNIPLSPDTAITAALPSEKLIEEHADMAIYVNGNAVLPDKCISVEEYLDANVSVSLQADKADGGILYGAGNYILGDTVNLVALSKEGYIFTGWYNENNTLVSTKRNIEFAAQKNINYTAHFDSISGSPVDDSKDVLVQSIFIQQSVTMQNSKQLQFDAKVLPENASNKKLKWSSSDESIAQVDQNGLVTALNIGQVTIMADSTDGSNISASCVITVTKANSVTPPDDSTGDNTGGNGSGSGGNSTGGNTSGDNTTGGNTSGDGTTGDNTAGGNTSSGGSTGNNPSGGTTGGSSSSGGSTGNNPSGGTTGGSSSGGNSSGGDTNNSNGDPAEDNNKPDDSIQIKLLYYIIEFNANAGTKLSRKTMTLLNDDNLGILPKVQRKNYTFNGWYTQKTGGSKVSSSTILNAGTTLFAQWTKVNKPSRVKAPTLKSNKAGQLAVSFQKITGAKGYEIAYSTNKKFPTSSTKKIVSASAKKTIKKLKSKKKYYVKVRAYKVDSIGNKIYGTYSKVKSVKIK